MENEKSELVYDKGAISAALRMLNIKSIELINNEPYGNMIIRMFEKTSVLPPFQHARNILLVHSANQQLNKGDGNSIVWNIPHRFACNNCGGIGIEMFRPTMQLAVPCKKCDSTGEWSRKCKRCNGKDPECINCHGKGIYKTPCLACVERDKEGKKIAEIGKGQLLTVIPKPGSLVTSFESCVFCDSMGRKGGMKYFLKKSNTGNTVIRPDQAEMLKAHMTGPPTG